MRVAVCVVVKSENHYLKEWVDHYLRIGFDNIILYDNNDLNGEKIEDVISDHIKSGFVIVEDIKGKKDIQMSSYNGCYKKYSHLYDWIAFFDADELLDLKDTRNIKDFLSKDIFAKFNCIKINWKVFDDNNLLKVENSNYSFKRFTHAVRYESYTAKSILKTNIPNCVINSSHGALRADPVSHALYEGNAFHIVCCDVRGIERTNTRDLFTPGRNNVCLNHYRYKTIEEYVLFKVVRGWPNTLANYGLDFFTISNFFSYNKLSYKKYKVAKDIFKQYNRKPSSYLSAICKHLFFKLVFNYWALFYRIKYLFYSLRHKNS